MLSAVCVALLVLSVLLLELAPGPFVWIGGLWAVFFFYIAARASAYVQVTFILLASLCLGVAVCDVAASLILLPAYELDVNAPYKRPDDEFGWRNAPGASAKVVKRIGAETLYSVRYTVDAAGRRISPPDVGEGVQGCVLFFADSFVFGQGVEDHQTLPYRVGIRSGGRFRIVNLGVSGYGPHHMLAHLTREGFAGTLPCTPTHIFYLAITHHVPRVAGKAVQGGPRYELAADSKLHRLANTAVKISNARLILESRLRRSYAFTLIEERHPGGFVSRSDFQLYGAVVSASGVEAKKQWPDVKLHVLAWDVVGWDATGFQRMVSELSRSGWVLHRADAILLEFEHDASRYAIHRFDPHPNPMAYDLLAAHVVEKILPPFTDRAVTRE